MNRITATDHRQETTIDHGRTEAPASSSAAAASGPGFDAPPSVTRGTKCQIHITLDWITVSMPNLGKLEETTQRLAERFGPRKLLPGRYNYAISHRFLNGANIYFTPAHETARNQGMCAEIPGDALAELSWDDKFELLSFLMMGGKCTRLDIALDFRGEDLQLIQLATASAERGELCGLRRWNPERHHDMLELVGHGVNFGRRGKNGSGRYVRIYDKGLETGEQAWGQWVRYESVFSKDAANLAAVKLLHDADKANAAASLALGCLDFRANTGDKHLSRRPRASAFSILICRLSDRSDFHLEISDEQGCGVCGAADGR